MHKDILKFINYFCKIKNYFWRVKIYNLDTKVCTKSVFNSSFAAILKLQVLHYNYFKDSYKS